MDICSQLWERRGDKFYVAGTDQEFILVTHRDCNVDELIKRHNVQIESEDK